MNKYNKFAAVGLIALSAIILSACKTNSQSGTQGNNKSQTQTAPVEEKKGAATITATDTGFDPKEVTINAGESITWVNNSSRTIQIGSANHPTHTVNPDLTGGQYVIEVPVGQSKTVSAGIKVGRWAFHNHLKPSEGGTVVIK